MNLYGETLRPPYNGRGSLKSVTRSIDVYRKGTISILVRTEKLEQSFDY